MDARCQKFHVDGTTLLRTSDGEPATSVQASKVLKELKTISRFLVKNQSPRFSENAQQKLLQAIGPYVTLVKHSTSLTDEEQTQVTEACFQVLKDALAMPFNVFGTKQKKRLLKWHNELIVLVGEHAEGDAEESGEQAVKWSVLAIEDDGYLNLLNEETAEMNEAFHVPRNEPLFRQIEQGLEDGDVTVETRGDRVIRVQVDTE